jgi:hypothetical protein
MRQLNTAFAAYWKMNSVLAPHLGRKADRQI